ncbi:hypothetical protein [Sphingomonas sp.]|jgi:hypothetical protein|uniref:hypothetical protein n=1 Tax=Sphingomonas sp. TaxID=28214 RepID=UPI002E13877E|nr:hypothetical protein [Sphingomonas sp.]
MTTEERPPLDEGTRAFVVTMLQKMPESISSVILADEAARRDLALPVEESIRIFDRRFSRRAVFDALHEVANGRKAELSSSEGKLTVDESSLRDDGSAILVAGGEGARFRNVGLMSDEAAVRSRTLAALLLDEDLSEEEERGIRAAVDAGPIGEDALSDLETLVKATPKAVYRNLVGGSDDDVRFDELVPGDREFFKKLLGSEPPATLGAYRGEWLVAAASLDPVRRARWIALTTPIAILKGDLIVPVVKDLDREVRLRLARFLSGAADPFSQVAAVQIAVAEHSDEDFRAVGDELIPRLLDRSHERTAASLSFLSSATVLTGAVTARRRILDGWPVYAKRLATHLHASLIVRTFGIERIDVEDMQRMVGRSLTQNHRLVELCDARSVPHNLWSAPSAERIHSAVVSRVIQALDLIPENDRPSNWIEAIDKVVETITSGPERLPHMAPGPFDPFEDDWSGLIELDKKSAEELVTRMIAKEVPQHTVSDIYNLVVAFDLGSEERGAVSQKLPDFLETLPDDGFTVAVDFALQLAARWKMSQLGERLIDMSLARARSDGLKNLSAGPTFSLLAAASNTDPEVWSHKTGEYMSGFAFALRPGPAIRNMIAAIDLIGDFSPALQPALTSARSFAMLALDEVPPAPAPQSLEVDVD